MGKKSFLFLPSRGLGSKLVAHPFLFFTLFFLLSYMRKTDTEEGREERRRGERKGRGRHTQKWLMVVGALAYGKGGKREREREE